VEFRTVWSDTISTFELPFAYETSQLLSERRGGGGQEGYAPLPSHLVNYVNQTLVKEELEIHDV